MTDNKYMLDSPTYLLAGHSRPKSSQYHSNSAYFDTDYRIVVCPSVYMSVTLVHLAKAVGRNEIPFGWDIRAVLGSIVLDRRPSPPRKQEILRSEPPSSQRCCQSPNYFGPVLSFWQQNCSWYTRGLHLLLAVNAPMLFV